MKPHVAGMRGQRGELKASAEIHSSVQTLVGTAWCIALQSPIAPACLGIFCCAVVLVALSRTVAMAYFSTFHFTVRHSHLRGSQGIALCSQWMSSVTLIGGL